MVRAFLRSERYLNTRILLPLFAGIVLIQMVSCKENEETVPKSSLECIIKDEFGGLQDSVKCEIVSGRDNFSATTNSNGRFKLEKLKVGKYVITYSKPHYIGGSEEIEVSAEPTVVELVLTAGNSFLRTSDSLLNITHSSGSRSIQIESNSSWTIASSASWVKPSTQSGSGNSTVFIAWETSNEDIVRSALVVVKAGAIEQKLRIIQTPPLKITSSKGVIGNYENGIVDSIKLTFNKPVSVNSITPGSSSCLVDIKHKAYGKNLSFTYSCAKLGESYPFTISVKDGTETFTFQINVKFYDKKILIPGYIIDYYIAEDNETIWAITDFPKKILKLSISDLSIKSEFDLDFTPSKIRWNSIKNKINIFKQADRCDFYKLIAGECDNNLIYFDPDKLSLSRSGIDLIDGYDATFGYPNVFPHDICLFSDGTGIIQLENEYNYMGWRFINSSNNDSTYISPFHFNSPYDIRYQSMHINYNKTKIYMMHPGGSTSIDIFESGDTHPVTYSSPLTGQSNFLIANKKNDKVYHAQLYEQFISDLDGYTSQVSYIDTRAFYGGADFSYKDGEDETIYNLADGLFQILDYKIAFTSFSTDTDVQMSKIQSTTDGENLIAIKQNSEGTTDLFVFNIDAMTTTRMQGPDAGRRHATNNSQLKSKWIK